MLQFKPEKMVIFNTKFINMGKNLYEELGLKKNATKSEIKSSYRSLVKKHHPDAGGEKERFLAIQNAWETLNDPIKKEQYDRKIFSHFYKLCIKDNHLFWLELTN